MTAHAIRRIIATLRDEGRTDACVLCPFCEGGTRRRKTLSINLRDGVWLWLCHRGTCPTKGAMPAAIMGGDFTKTKPVFEPRLLMEPLSLPRTGDPIADRLDELLGNSGDHHAFSIEHGLRVYECSRTTHVWRMKGLDGEARGWITRDEVKHVQTWRESPRPFYGAFMCDGSRPTTGPLVVVEDCLSAALLAEAGLSAVALSGTNMTREVAQEIAEWATKTLRTTVLIALDPDVAGIRGMEQASDRLASLGVDVHKWLLVQDIHRLTVKERKDLVAEIVETMNSV